MCDIFRKLHTSNQRSDQSKQIGLNSHLVLVLVDFFHFGPTFEIVFSLVLLSIIFFQSSPFC